MPSAAIAAGGTWRGSRRVLLLLPLVLVVSPAAATTLAELPDLQQEAAALHAAWAGDASQRQCFGFSLSSSIARDDFEYPDLTTGARRVAKKGELINMRCDSVVCPNPPVPDCYLNEGICADDEWCQLEDQVRFGPWAMADGETPNVQSAECRLFKEQGYDWIFSQVCRNVSHWGPWKPVRGRCAKYRSEQQSCNAYFAAVTPAPAPAPEPAPSGGAASASRSRRRHARTASSSGSARTLQALLQPLDAFHPPRTSQQQQQLAGAGAPSLLADLSPHYVVSEVDGRPPVRPQLCAPGLVCTGDTDPLPYTCVKIRPPNTCYQGPWWDSSSWCKVGGHAGNAFYGGLPLAELKSVAQALLVQLPVEVYGGPTNPAFWDSPAADTARRRIQAIVATLWPDAYRSATKFPLELPDPRTKGPTHSSSWNATASAAAVLFRQSNKVWSTIQTLVHNARDPLSPAQVKASRALAVWLRQHFMCCNCRGMWANYVLNNVGLPPLSSSRFDHARWWWRAQNMVSEHAAASRGGHPFVWQSQLDADFAARYAEYGGRLKCQNPWFLPYEFAELMWAIPEK